MHRNAPIFVHTYCHKLVIIWVATTKYSFYTTPCNFFLTLRHIRPASVDQSECILIHFFVVDVLGICTGWYFTAFICCNHVDRNFSSRTPTDKKKELKLRAVSECSSGRIEKWLTLGSWFPGFVMTDLHKHCASYSRVSVWKRGKTFEQCRF